MVGTATAFFLAEAGHAVSVIDRQAGPALETSFANGGQISACHVKPWASPGMPFQALRWMMAVDAPLRFKPLRWDPDLWRWSLHFLANCTRGRASVNLARALRLALYSRDVLRDLRRRLDLAYGQEARGILHIYRTAEAFANARETALSLRGLGLQREVLSAAECLVCEPALRDGPALAGGLLSTADETGDAHLFTVQLAAAAAARGVHFHYGETVKRLVVARGAAEGVETDRQFHAADAVVICLGSFSPRLVRQLGLVLPVYPAKGYSITLDIADATAAPRVGIIDDAHYIVMSRLGGRLRVAGTAELAGFDTTIDPRRVRPLVRVARELFPNASTYAEINPWTGLRPATPDSVPVLGPAGYPNLFLNTGHGTLGWTMACGSAKVVADMISGREPDIDLEGLSLARFKRRPRF